MNNIYLKVGDLKTSIAALLVEYPELADDADLMADTLEGETDAHKVLEKLVDMVGEASTMANAIKARAAEISARKSRFEAKEEAARKLIITVMNAAQITKLQLVEATLSIRDMPPAPFVIDETQLPESCVRIERKPDMKAIKAEIESGKTIAGTAMSNGKQSLTIRIK